MAVRIEGIAGGESEPFGDSQELRWGELDGSVNFDAEQSAGPVEVQGDLSHAASPDHEVLDGLTSGGVLEGDVGRVGDWIIGIPHTSMESR